MKDKGNTSPINPSYYQVMSIETWEMMIRIWGKEKFIAHCEMTAFKYRMRIGKKKGQPELQDLKKAEWYEAKATELSSITT